MDEMMLYEIFDIMELLPYAQKYNFEVMRNIMWSNLKQYLKNQNITPEKFLPLYTDKDNFMEGPKILEEAEIIKLKEKVLENWNNMNHNKQENLE